jgi:uncharacterized membrane protein YbjE (DUF340 family)
MLDLRKPAGYFFLLLGAILAAVGATMSFTAPLLNRNLNLEFGIFSIAFGLVVLLLARRG